MVQALHEGCMPRLKRFMGRPQEYSPKARLLNFLGYRLPFDRHDWIVDRCGREVKQLLCKIDIASACVVDEHPRCSLGTFTPCCRSIMRALAVSALALSLDANVGGRCAT